MTSEAEAIKTNEFLRRRKLRLQQVREQSKDIAKKIRQRANVEKLRQVVDLDAKKQKEYFECQEKLVKRLEVLYAKGLENVGASHLSASELTQQDEVAKTDKSKLRGKEATVELRRKKQEKLDQQKKLLDRKVQAREAANEISRDKSSVVANKLYSKSTSIKVTDDPSHKVGTSSDLVNSKETDKEAGTSKNEVEIVKTSDMATQWDMETIPEWEPSVPALSLPTDKDTPKDSDDFIGSKVEQSKRLDLFAISKEMPTSLRGKHTLEAREKEPGRPSLTIVSEYLQNRKLRLRETQPTLPNKQTDDMQSLKQTIERTRSIRPEGIPFNICQVHDQQIIPVPTWQAERSCRFCSHTPRYHSPVPSRQFKSVTNAQINQIFSSIRPVRQGNLPPSPVVRGRSPFRRSKVDPNIFPGKGPASNEKAKNVPVNTGQRKSSVVVYNHSTRDSRDLPYGDDKLVVRDLQSEEDAYSQAMKEVSAFSVRDKEQKKVQDLRNRVAVTKQNVEKEYKDTMNFLNSLPKDKGSKVIKNAYMDERRQQIQHESRQQKMQQEYKKIEKECKKHNCSKNRNQSKSPVNRQREQDINDNFESRDFQYSWMPVPEADGNLAIHAIPNTVKQGKSGNSVKFSQVDSYHEYRSRHKHTPPTKDTSQDKPAGKRIFGTVLIDKDTTESSDSSSITSDTSSIVNLRAEPKRKHRNAKEINQNLSDAERIIIYKVLDSKADKKSKRQTKLLNEIAKSLTCIGKSQQSETQHTSTSKSTENALSFEQLNEGIYKVVEEKGDNIGSMYYDTCEVSTARSEDIHRRPCHCRSPCKSQQCDRGTLLQWESGDCPAPASTTNESQWPSASKKKASSPAPARQSSGAPSTTSFTTAPNEKDNVSEGGYIKLVSETGQAAGKFIIDSSGLLNNNAYEVVIQLRKKDKAQENINNKIPDDNTLPKQNIQSGRQMNDSIENNRPVSSETDVKDLQPTSDGDTCKVLSDRSDKDKQSTKIPLQSEPTTTYIMTEEPNMLPANKEKNDIETNNEISDDRLFVQPSENKKNTCEKGISTCLPEEVKVDQLPRQSTTTCTQTTLSSPIHRPVFFHMSSSTSTAYMSPPEMILPNFLRHDCPTTEDEIYNPLRTIELIGKEYRGEFGDCTCRKCMHAKKMEVNKVYMEPFARFNDSGSTTKNSAGTERIKTRNKTDCPKKRSHKPDLKRHQATATESTFESESSGRFNSTDVPVSMSTQTTQNVDMNADTNYMKVAEDKLQNMEKIADLTEKCTKRLSNLAKVLEEVRRNKSLAYSQISSAESTDSRSDKPLVSPIAPIDIEPNDFPLRSETKSPEPILDKVDSFEKELLQSENINVLADIPKPVFKDPLSNLSLHPKVVEKLDTPLHVSTKTPELLVKSRPKPPPALSRLSLKHGQEYIIPHELSTVIEVDSPMSIKHKNQSARNDAKENTNNSNRSSSGDKTVDDSRKSDDGKESAVNPDLLQTKSQLSKIYKFSSTESSDDSKFQMIDLKQFNEIMLEPFISIQEYAKQYNMEPPDEGSNLDDIQREDAINDDISSLHSDGSLPDVIAELLKRNIITEPFKFDTASNINSTTVSSESTLSMLALSKARRGRRRTNVVSQNKENIGETSDTLSFSSNPDLENAFKKLGMGWASSTLKKTKERLALSSSSNTSSSSLSQFKTKKSQEVPALVTDSVSSLGNPCKSSTHNRNTVDNSKNAEQQTTFSNSMTVKEFLRNELAKKITFTNKSNVNDTQEEFVSLFETKMPEEMKESSQVNRDECSEDSARSGTNRARTSTPVQLFKSLTYRSSSSSNISNGLFSNADDLSSVKMTSNSNKNHSTSDKDDLTIPNFSLRLKKNSDSKSD
ncbi:hypothetical protein PYW07_014390 [Mythimna separata]|uniref:Uncharacterized protein n=1 Tax=Mythimna separata TaxID=271217 RepID=A0AAD8E0A9_MYTSE|nr:hypothetical protein PYW07_014390 [Mythimna separata]